MRALETARLLLLPQAVAHAAEMFDVLSDPAIYTYENAPPSSADWLRKRFERLETRRSPDGTQLWLNWVARLRGAGLIGYVQATVFEGGKAAIAYEFASAHWGQGLAREAVEALLCELHDTYQVREVVATAKSANRRSLRLLERLRFAPAADALLSLHPVERDEVLFCRRLD